MRMFMGENNGDIIFAVGQKKAVGGSIQRGLGGGTVDLRVADFLMAVGFGTILRGLMGPKRVLAIRSKQAASFSHKGGHNLEWMR